MALEMLGGSTSLPQDQQDLPDRTEREAEIAGLDALDVPIAPARGALVRAWEGIWPKLTAIGLFFFGWQAVVWAHLKPEYVLPGPITVLKALWHGAVDTGPAGSHILLHATATTLQRAAVGYSLSVVIGVVLGLVVSRSKILRAGVGSMITGLQTMPTIAWLPLAVLLFKLSETAITFVVVMGAAPPASRRGPRCPRPPRRTRPRWPSPARPGARQRPPWPWCRRRRWLRRRDGHGT